MRRLLAFVGCVVLLGACWDDAPSEAEGTDPVSAREPVSADDFDYEEYLEVLREASRVDDPPETELVRVVAPDEKPEVWKACMQEAGFDVSVTFDGGMAPPQGLPDNQWEAYDLAHYICHAQYPVDQSMHRGFAMEQVDVVYRYYVDQLRPCLRDQGYDVGDPPTLETFRASWVTDDGGGLVATDDTWAPYHFVDPGELGPEEWEELNAACPQAPSNELMFGDDG